MSFFHAYRPLCIVNLYHEYFLNDGLQQFDDVLLPNLKPKQLQKYDFQYFMRIVPSARTKILLSGQKILMKRIASGFKLFAYTENTVNNGIYKPKIDLEQEEKLDFLLYVTDSLFENYSTIGSCPEIPFYFSNKKPITELGSFNYINIETDIPQTPIENFTITELTYKAITNRFLKTELNNLFGIISLSVAADDVSKSILDINGQTKFTPPIFKIQLRNRETIWSYLDATDGSLIHKTPTTLPLVKNGMVGYTFNSTAKRPSAKPDRLVFVKDSSGNIIETISEIFI